MLDHLATSRTRSEPCDQRRTRNESPVEIDHSRNQDSRWQTRISFKVARLHEPDFYRDLQKVKPQEDLE